MQTLKGNEMFVGYFGFGFGFGCLLLGGFLAVNYWQIGLILMVGHVWCALFIITSGYLIHQFVPSK